MQQGVIWVGTDDGRVHVTRDGGQTWESVEGRVRGVPENTWVPHIEPSKYDAGTAFVVFDDHRRGNFTPYVFRVTEFGNRWQSLVTEDLWGYALVIEQDPVDQDLLFLGTEFGLFVSSNGGANWMKWKHGLPTASTIALIVHPREHDLVIGTHGLAAFVLDDIRPLRSVSTEILAQPIHLFDIPDAVQYTVKQTGASRFPGNGEFRGENRDYGALITFSLNDEDLPHPNEDIERERKAAKREATGGEEESAGEQEAGAGPGRGGRPDRGPQVKVVVTDAGGDSIAGFERPVELGVNRIAWNLRRDGFERPRAGPGGEESFFFGGGFGPDVLPGTYTVTLKYKEHEASGSVNVLPDPRYDLTVAQRREKYDALMHAGQVQETLAEAVKRLRDTRDEIDKVLSMLKEDEGGTEEPEAEAGEPEQDIRKDAAELKKKLTELEERLWMPPGTAKGIARDSSIYSRVSNAYYSMSSSWDPPTEGEQIYLRYAEQRLQAALDEINQVFADDVAEFRGSVESAGIAFLERKEPLALPER